MIHSTCATFTCTPILFWRLLYWKTSWESEAYIYNKGHLCLATLQALLLLIHYGGCIIHSLHTLVGSCWLIVTGYGGASKYEKPYWRHDDPRKRPCLHHVHEAEDQHQELHGGWASRPVLPNVVWIAPCTSKSQLEIEWLTILAKTSTTPIQCVAMSAKNPWEPSGWLRSNFFWQFSAEHFSLPLLRFNFLFLACLYCNSLWNGKIDSSSDKVNCFTLQTSLP
jgi:hypothetical protein